MSHPFALRSFHTALKIHDHGIFVFEDLTLMVKVPFRCTHQTSVRPAPSVIVSRQLSRAGIYTTTTALVEGLQKIVARGTDEVTFSSSSRNDVMQPHLG